MNPNSEPITLPRGQNFFVSDELAAQLIAEGRAVLVPDLQGPDLERWNQAVLDANPI